MVLSKQLPQALRAGLPVWMAINEVFTQIKKIIYVNTTKSELFAILTLSQLMFQATLLEYDNMYKFLPWNFS